MKTFKISNKPNKNMKLKLTEIWRNDSSCFDIAHAFFRLTQIKILIFEFWLTIIKLLSSEIFEFRQISTHFQ